MGVREPPPIRDEYGRRAWLAVWGPLFHRTAVYVKARTLSDAEEVIGSERPDFGPPKWVRPAGEAMARRLFASHSRLRRWIVRVPVLEQSLP